MLDRLAGPADSDFTAYTLLAVIRADLIERLVGRERVPREELRARLADFTTRMLGSH